MALFMVIIVFKVTKILGAIRTNRAIRAIGLFA